MAEKRRLMVCKAVTFLLGFAIPLFAGAATLDICTRVMQVINHPAEFVSEKIKRGGIKCFLQPFCCTPLWVSNPACYIIEQKKIKDAWTETKQVTKCRKESVQDGLREFVTAWTNRTALASMVINPNLLAAYRHYVDALAGQGDLLPDDVKQMLATLVRIGGIVPFAEIDIENARWLRDSGAAASILSPRKLPGNLRQKDKVAIVHSNLILVSPEMANSKDCLRIAYWAHEVTHVYQNRKLGANQFLDRYLREAQQKGYENISFEVEAYGVQNRVMRFQICNLLGFNYDTRIVPPFLRQ